MTNTNKQDSQGDSEDQTTAQVVETSATIKSF